MSKKPRIRPKNTKPQPVKKQTPTPATTSKKPVAKRQSKYQVSTSTMARGVQPIKLRNPPQIPEPVVFYTPEAFQKMRHIVSTCELEVGWMCLVDNLGHNKFVIYEVFVPKQEVTAVTTEISPEGMAELALHLVENNHDPSRLYAWFHSHVNMGVTPSTQDELQVEEFIEDCPIFIRGIWNKKGDEKVDVYFRDLEVAFTNVRTQILLPDLPVETIQQLDKAIKENVEEEIVRYTPYGRKGHTSTKTHATNSFTYEIPNDDIDDELYELYNGIESTTGYTLTWDELTPVRNRPKGWANDPLYRSISYEVADDDELAELGLNFSLG